MQLERVWGNQRYECWSECENGNVRIETVCVLRWGWIKAREIVSIHAFALANRYNFLRFQGGQEIAGCLGGRVHICTDFRFSVVLSDEKAYLLACWTVREDVKHAA